MLLPLSSCTFSGTIADPLPGPLTALPYGHLILFERNPANARCCRSPETVQLTLHLRSIFVAIARRID